MTRIVSFSASIYVALVVKIKNMNRVLIIDKPSEITSHDVVAKVRRIVSERRVGHSGTLDPFATGVLVVCIGRNTRLMQFLVGLDKEYLATIRLGFATDTQDVTGKHITGIVASNEVRLSEIKRVMSEFTGPQKQVPPMYSAKKIAGRRLYDLARQGSEVERQAVDIVVHSAEICTLGRSHVAGDGDLPDERVFVDNPDGTRDFVMKVRCSSGTYVRTFAHDIGMRLGVGAHLSALRRTAVGHLSLDQAITLDALANGGKDLAERVGLSPAVAVAHLDSMSVSDTVARRVENGMDFALIEDGCLFQEGKDARPVGIMPVRILDEEQNLVAVGEFNPETGIVRPKVVIGRGKRAEN